MTRHISLGGMIAATSISFTGAAWADVSAQSVWEDWKAYMEGTGYAVSGTESTEGNVLTISDLTATFDIPEGDGEVVVDLHTIALTENNDGSVTVAMPPEYQMLISSGGDDFVLGLNFAQSGMTIVATGDDAETAYDFLAPEMVITMTELKGDGRDIPGTLNGVISGYQGQFLKTDGDLTSMTGTGSVNAVSVDLEINDPVEEAQFDLNMGMADLAVTFAGALPADYDPINMAANFAAGLDFSGTYEIGKTTFDLKGAGDGETFSVVGTSDSASVDFAMNNQAFLLSELAKGVDVTISGSSIPLPEINISAAEYGLNFLMPTSPAEEPGELALGLRLVDLAVSDMIWGMFDPGSVLPRDPATLILDLTGQAKLFANLFDPEQMEDAAMTGAPGELHQLSLNDLTLRFAGVDATGAGAFTFDNEDLATYDGLPRPEGQAEFEINGANGLLDNIVAMGFLPENEAMGFRMMMGLFAVPGEGEDSLTSKVEINAEGHLLVNGQRLK